MVHCIKIELSNSNKPTNHTEFALRMSLSVLRWTNNQHQNLCHPRITFYLFETAINLQVGSYWCVFAFSTNSKFELPIWTQKRMAKQEVIEMPGRRLHVLEPLLLPSTVLSLVFSVSDWTCCVRAWSNLELAESLKWKYELWNPKRFLKFEKIGKRGQWVDPGRGNEKEGFWCPDCREGCKYYLLNSFHLSFITPPIHHCMTLRY